MGYKGDEARGIVMVSWESGGVFQVEGDEPARDMQCLRRGNVVAYKGYKGRTFGPKRGYSGGIIGS